MIRPLLSDRGWGDFLEGELIRCPWVAAALGIDLVLLA